MRPALQSLPLKASFDLVLMVSSAPVGVLKKRLPIAELELASHKFEIVRYDGPDPRLRSRIIAVGVQSPAVWQLLAKHHATLERYRITHAEVAFDLETGPADDGCPSIFELVGLLRKPRHKRGHLRLVHETDKIPPHGCLAEPTCYFEDRKATVKLKCYSRQQKLSGHRFGRRCLRIEWTLSGKPALVRHLSGNQIQNLVDFDFRGFLKRNLRLERVDHVALGRLFHEKGRGMPDTDDRAERAAFFVLRWLAHREMDKFPDWKQAKQTCLYSPAQIRGFLRELRDKDHARRRGRPKRGPRRSNKITDYRINGCFVPLQHQLGDNYNCQAEISDHNRTDNNNLSSINQQAKAEELVSCSNKRGQHKMNSGAAAQLRASEIADSR